MIKGEEKLLAKVMEEPSDPLHFNQLPREIQEEMIALNIDPADQTITKGVEAEKVSRTTALIFKNRNNLHELRQMLSTLGLNDGIYDEQKNPGGILLDAGARLRNRSAAAAYALYRLKGVQISLLGLFLGVSEYYENQSIYYSRSLFERIEQLAQKRSSFPLQHSQQIPALRAVEEQIRGLTGLTIGDIFQPDAVPLISPHKKQLSIITVLQAYALAVSGKHTITAIAKHLSVSQSVFLRLFSNKLQYVQFTPAALEALTTRIKRRG